MTVYLPYVLTLRAPALLTVPASDPNRATTLPYVPGSAVRGAVARALGDPSPGGPDWDEFHRLVLSGSVRYLNTYPVVGGRRSLPAPISMRAEKGTSLSAGSGSLLCHDLAAWDGAVDDDLEIADHWPECALGGPVAGFVTADSTDLVVAPVGVSGRSHHQRDRIKGRAWTDPVTEEAHGTIFAYESLDEGQELAGLVAVDDDADPRVEQVEERLHELLGNGLLVGKSRRAGYGGNASVAWGARRPRESEATMSTDVPEGDELRVLLTSPYVGRNPATGQPDPTWLEHEIVSLVGQAAVERVRTRWAFTVVGGYNRTWGLPLPQQAAVAGGSVVVLRARRTLARDELLGLEHAGLGERRTEGCGRFVFLAGPVREVSVERRATPTSGEEPGGAVPKLVAEIEDRIAVDRIRRAVDDLAARTAESAERVPTASLLGRLRVPFRRGPEAGLAELRLWLSGPDHKLRQPAMDQLRRCRLEGTTLAAWLVDLASAKPERMKQLLGLEMVAQRAHIGPENGLLERLAGESSRHSAWVIDATLAALQRRQRIASKSEGEASDG